VFDLEKETIFGEPIIKFEVQFMTPYGLFPVLADARERVKISGFDPNDVIVPVTVAVSDKNYEVIHRGV
jgi:hypothetical protein